jgi:lipopolysaccharide/colanic/teichoic acid biosynthesis glycosyltransferase
VRRVGDIVFAGVLAVAAAPLLMLIGAAIRLTSPGPVMFKQMRIGRNKVPFVIFKFRTMVDRGARPIDQRNEAVLAGEDDARITPLGRFLRRTSLDELPQLLNILRGEMTFVGPRPLLPEQLLAIPPKYEARFLVRPGITGLAQVKGRRGLDWLEQLSVDATYAVSRNAAVDLEIVLGTVNVVLSGKGTYSPTAKNWRAYVNESTTGDSAAESGQ